MPAVSENMSKRYHLIPLNEETADILPLLQKKTIPEFHQQAASSSFAALEPAYINNDRFFKKKTEPQQEGHNTTVEQKKKHSHD